MELGNNIPSANTTPSFPTTVHDYPFLPHSPTSNGTLGVSDGPSKDTTNGVESHEYSSEGIVIIRGNSHEQEALAPKLAHSLKHSTGKRAEIGDISLIETSEKLCVFILELEKPFLSTLTSSEFLALQRALIGSRGILWVIRGAYVSFSDPTANMANGLSRSIRSETMLKFATLDLEYFSGKYN